jgi:uncharacterized circularly permuted ATP-grasp superfamily protein
VPIITAGSTNYTAGAASQSFALPAVASQTAVLVTNNGLHNAYIKLGTFASVNADTASTVVPPGRTRYIAIGANTFIAVMSPAGSNVDMWTAL